MKQQHFLFREIIRIGLITALFFIFNQSPAQLCSNPAGVIYGLTNGGFIHSIPIATGIVPAAALNPAYTGNAPLNSNGLGYSTLTQKFYYFKRPPDGAPQEFFRYDPLAPVASAYLLLPGCPTTLPVYVGTVTGDGTGYYCWDSNATLFYYDIVANTWTTIANTIIDQSGGDISTVIRTYGSGDITADGNGSLVFVPSGTAKYAVYQLMAPLPTTNVGTITVKTLLPLTAPPAKIVGVTMNPTGQIILCTASPFNKLYRLENNLTLTLLSTMTVSMGDLASCSFPMTVLSLKFANFAATLKENVVSVTWQMLDVEHEKGYSIEQSVNGKDWQEIGYIAENNNAKKKCYTFLHGSPANGVNFYRLRLEGVNKDVVYSEVKTIMVKSKSSFHIWPNPMQQTVSIQNDAKNFMSSKAIFFDQSGKKIKESTLAPGTTNIDVTSLSGGTYVLRIVMPDGSVQVNKLIKE